ncbi:hypothetical protein [Candidatus Contubernalis alkaliaceticus]|uniref:hypothetical protein n=1 Tax=Candidatus Contubernalis alkaliaceticus TaxID=338645 RepID=UPI001F4BEE6D|nr:hypothetical protein [Candidatus Contubernalis alkalaceticus]UNC91212.1 hypothetical protein HUE98_03370 [Candidatus Contubernalis alkalaceticus]
MYLIRQEQFGDVVAQENSVSSPVTFFHRNRCGVTWRTSLVLKIIIIRDDCGSWLSNAGRNL